LSEDREVTVQIKFGELEQTLKGKPEEVWILINRFFAKTFPAIKILKEITFTTDLEKIVEDLKGIIEISKEGPYILIPKNKLTDKEFLILNLLGMHIGYKLGILDRNYLLREELREMLGKSAKILSTRLGELCRDRLVSKNERDEYRITDFGIRYFQTQVLQKIKTKVS